MTETVSIQKISQEEARRLLNSCDGIGGHYEPLGLFYLEESSSASTTAPGTPGPRSSLISIVAFDG